MFSLRVVGAFSLLRCVLSQEFDSPMQIVNLINPLWALPDGENSTRGLGASVVNVDSTATTYAISCDATAELVPGPTPITCIWETVGAQVFTQWETSLQFSHSFTGFDDVTSYEGDFKFPSTLAPSVTGTFTLSVAAQIGVTQDEGTITAMTRTSLQTGTTSATWYAILITAGGEKLAAASSSRTASGTASSASNSQVTGTSSQTETSSTASGSGTVTSSSPIVTSTPSTSSGTGGADAASPSTTSSIAAAEKVGRNIEWLGGVVGGILGMFFL
ncbi:hypothetical protein ONS95_002501 [Cadophora gregata]|uniref:uncharacterized protein n=1 Tax=Cadophora gregata TaxID=51156 RepID=UPI0026DB49A4|nr:uncharacterized protein ONS95_002501 [Cadophora gregata]KAK0109830.1 hypothetical protein ONS95_002501 [Cadophora gregata]KAK0110545.1 hypothetical protein ONS96_002151 [Cadophora gregata f. sp. sojae]